MTMAVTTMPHGADTHNLDVGFDLAGLFEDQRQRNAAAFFERCVQPDKHDVVAARFHLNFCTSSQIDAVDPAPARRITLCQRKTGKLGANLGKTTGWIHRASLKKRRVEMLHGCQYVRIDDEGLHLMVEGEARVLNVDHVVICAGQVPARGLADELTVEVADGSADGRVVGVVDEKVGRRRPPGNRLERIEGCGRW